jgi:uncharacterized protein (TIGR02246 family)
MRFVHVVTAGMCTIAFAACETRAPEATGTAPAAETMTVDVAAEEQAIRDVNSQMLAAAAAKDAAALASFFATDGRVMMDNAPAAVGTAAVAEAWGGMLQLPGASLTWTPTLIRVANSGDLAYDVGTYTLSFDGPDGKVTDNGKYVTVWTKVDGQWKVAADIGNSDLPASN